MAINNVSFGCVHKVNHKQEFPPKTNFNKIAFATIGAAIPVAYTIVQAKKNPVGMARKIVEATNITFKNMKLNPEILKSKICSLPFKKFVEKSSIKFATGICSTAFGLVGFGIGAIADKLINKRIEKNTIVEIVPNRN